MKTVFLITLSLVFINIGRTQQLTQFSQYLKNPFIVNPAASGVYDYIDVRIIGRNQWAGYTNAPISSNLYFTMPISPITSSSSSFQSIGGSKRESEIRTGKMKHAIGGQVITDQYGAFRRISLSGVYSVHIPLNKNYNLSFGTQLGVSNHSFLPERAIVLNFNSDQTYLESIANRSNKNIFNLNTGLYLYSKTIFAGLSMNEITKNAFSFGPGTAYFNPKMHFNLMGGMKINVNRDMSLTPSFLMKYMYKSPLNLETSVQFAYKDWIWTNLSYRFKDAVVVGFGCNVSNRFRVGYSYDISASKLRNYSSGSHELMIGIMLDRE